MRIRFPMIDAEVERLGIVPYYEKNKVFINYL